jgi:glycosyltransferase involved in cell wall biosynthesis
VPTALLVLAAITCLAAALMLLELVLGGRRLPYLRDQSEAESGPRVSVVIAARDEATTIEAALASVLRQRYTNYEVIAVDDRSADETGAILDRVAAQEPRLRVMHIVDLPPGWLGKNHALHGGAAMATGEILLFTDADVVFDPTVIGRTVSAMDRNRLDHVTMAPDLDSPTLPLALVVNLFALSLCLLFRPWRASQRTSTQYMGIGAFNAVRTALYHEVEGHTQIAMRPDDDMKLGKLLKRNGGRQQVMIGMGLMRVRWYATLGELVRGLQKNAFSVFDYSIGLAVAAVLAQLTFNVWPFAALVLTRGITQGLNLAAAVLLMTMYALVAKVAGTRPWLAVLYPVAATILAYIVASATWRTVARGGIEWRGTFYPLAALEKNML